MDKDSKRSFNLDNLAKETNQVNMDSIYNQVLEEKNMDPDLDLDLENQASQVETKDILKKQEEETKEEEYAKKEEEYHKKP